MLKYDKKSMVIVPIEPDNNMVGTGQWSNQADSSPLGSEAAIKCYKRMLSERPYIQPVVALSDVQVLVDALEHAREVTELLCQTDIENWKSKSDMKVEMWCDLRKYVQALKTFEELTK